MAHAFNQVESDDRFGGKSHHVIGCTGAGPPVLLTCTGAYQRPSCGTATRSHQIYRDAKSEDVAYMQKKKQSWCQSRSSTISALIFHEQFSKHVVLPTHAPYCVGVGNIRVMYVDEMEHVRTTYFWAIEKRILHESQLDTSVGEDILIDYEGVCGNFVNLKTMCWFSLSERRIILRMIVTDAFVDDKNISHRMQFVESCGGASGGGAFFIMESQQQQQMEALELSYIGVVPDVIPVSPTPKPALADPDECENAGGGAGAGAGKDYENMEFPDMNLVEENQIMLSEYVGLPCTAMETQSSESLLTSEDVDGAATESHDAGVRVVQSFSTDYSTADSAGAFRSETAASSVSTTESPAAAVPATPQSNPSEPSGNALSSAGQKEKASDAAEVDSSPTVQESPAVNSPSTVSENAVDKPPPAMSFNFAEEVQVNQKEIMDMYMKSMQQFTESLAKMKLPLDMDNGSDKSGSGPAAASPTDSSGTDSSAAAKKPTAGAAQEKSPKVFYGSRAFF
ncbi:hypothetical protein TRIUR3_18229 [Triticum urartu]|uniref:Uncharacterized protein n=1 Tax=Triticum urartu TaxID=4572 RepID=M8ADE0_TRIUA|nr:hypothetical protein TRIUR3_18229 [Triticum urartu]